MQFISLYDILTISKILIAVVKGHFFGNVLFVAQNAKPRSGKEGKMDYCKEEQRVPQNYHVIKIPRLSYLMQKYKGKLLGTVLCSTGIVATVMLPEDAIAGVFAVLMGIVVIARM